MAKKYLTVPMTEVMRRLAEGYVGKEIEIPEPKRDFYDDLYDRVSQAVDG
jgi:phage antirepressor YoqD-like protein